MAPEIERTRRPVGCSRSSWSPSSSRRSCRLGRRAGAAARAPGRGQGATVDPRRVPGGLRQVDAARGVAGARGAGAAGGVGDAGRGRRRRGRPLVARHRGAVPRRPGARPRDARGARRDGAGARGRAAAAGERARRAARVALVLDDFHRLSSASTRSSVAWFVEHLPATVQLVLSSRTDPALPLGTLRARGQLLELRADELRFTAAETDEFLNGRLGLELDSADVELLVARTEGWPAGALSRGAVAVGQARTSTRWSGRSTARARTSSTSSPARCSRLTSPSCRRSCCARRCSSASALRSATRSSSAPTRPRRSRRWRARTSSCCRWTIGGSGFASTTSSPRSSASSWSGASPQSCPRCTGAPSRGTASSARPTRPSTTRSAAGAFAEAGELIAETWVHYANAGRTTSVLDWLARFPEPILDSDPRLLAVKAWVAALRAARARCAPRSPARASSAAWRRGRSRTGSRRSSRACRC